MKRMIATLMLSACTAQEVAPPVVSFRDASAPLSGSTRFEASRFAGKWRALACIGPCALSESYVPATDGVWLRHTASGTNDYTIVAPGVLKAQGADTKLVVMWVDEGFRTAAIGDAQGRWAAIIDRGNGAVDRTKAAKEMLRFNGFDVTKLLEVTCSDC